MLHSSTMGITSRFKMFQYIYNTERHMCTHLSQTGETSPALSSSSWTLVQMRLSVDIAPLFCVQRREREATLSISARCAFQVLIYSHHPISQQLI